jgi:hypothetical protein
MAKGGSGGGKPSGGGGSKLSGGGSSGGGSKPSGGGGSKPSGGGGSKPSGGGGSKPSPAAVNFATQYVKTHAATGKPGKNKPAAALPTAIGKPFGNNKPSGGGMSSGGGGMSAPTSIQQVFGGGKLTNKEFTQARQQFGGKAVKDYIRGNATADQLGSKLADRLGGLNSMQQFFGKAPGTTPDTTPQTPESKSDPGPQGQPEPEAYDFSAAMEEQLAPLRQQIQDLLSKQQETKPTTGGGITDGSSGGLSKPGYSYNPSGNTVGYPQGGSDTSPDLFKNWMSNQESLNRSSTAYMFSPGGTRRSDEANGAASATSAGGSNDWNKFWDPADGDAVDREWQASDSDTSAADAQERLKRSRSSQRMAGSIFDGVSPTGSSSTS